MARPLRSRHFTNRAEDQVRRLNQCGTDDAYHIESGQTGTHVAAIQQALLTFRARASSVPALAPLLKGGKPLPRISNDEFDRGFYGPTTRDAVAAYKQAFDIRRTGQTTADDIVGIMTIDRMDDHMLAIEGRGGSGRVVPRIKRQDLVVMFPGAGTELHGQKAENHQRMMQASLAEAIAARAPLYHDQFIDPPAVIAYFGAPRDSGKSAVPAVFSAIVSLTGMLAREHAMLGRIFVYGSSIGGYNALTLASGLAATGKPIRYLRLGDAAFRQNDPNVTARTGDGRSFPVFTPPGPVNARESANTFQTRGNELVSVVGTIPELHGGVAGIPHDDVTNDGTIKGLWEEWVAAGRPSDRKNSLFDRMHDRAVAIADEKFRQDVMRIVTSMH